MTKPINPKLAERIAAHRQKPDVAMRRAHAAEYKEKFAKEQETKKCLTSTAT